MNEGVHSTSDRHENADNPQSTIANAAVHWPYTILYRLSVDVYIASDFYGR